MATRWIQVPLAAHPFTLKHWFPTLGDPSVFELPLPEAFNISYTGVAVQEHLGDPRLETHVLKYGQTPYFTVQV